MVQEYECGECSYDAVDAAGEVDVHQRPCEVATRDPMSLAPARGAE